MQPAEAGRHVGEASSAADQIPPPAEERLEEDGRAVGAGHRQQHGTVGGSLRAALAAFCAHVNSLSAFRW